MIAVVLMGIGFAIPYTPIFDAGEHVFPDTPVASLSLFTFVSNGSPMLLIPLVGAALEASEGELALLVLAAFVLTAGLINLRTPELRRIVPERSAEAM